MHMPLAALAAWVVAIAVASPTAAADPLSPPPPRPGAPSTSPLTLDDAFERVAGRHPGLLPVAAMPATPHPDLRGFAARGDALAAAADLAAQRPALVAGAELEDVLGTGGARGLDGAQLTLTLASVLERGGKLDARRTLANSRIDALAVERETRRLDLLAEVARRHLAAVSAQAQAAIAQADIAQRRRTVAAARQRLQAGASPESVVLTAQAALARAELEHARSGQRLEAARRHLAALWGEREPTFSIAAGEPTVLPAIDSLPALAALLDATPELARFADERRIGQARLQLARSAGSADVDWQLGVRRSQAGDDLGLVGGIAIALGSRSRALPGLRIAEAELAALEIEREAAGMALYSTLAEAHGRYRVAQLDVRRLGEEVLPLLARAETAAERAYRAGAISYLEWAQLQSERTAARRQRLDAALDAHRALIEIQRLTGQAFTATGAQAQGPTP